MFIRLPHSKRYINLNTIKMIEISESVISYRNDRWIVTFTDSRNLVPIVEYGFKTQKEAEGWLENVLHIPGAIK